MPVTVRHAGPALLAALALASGGCDPDWAYSDAGGEQTVEVQQHPVAGLAAVESFPATPAEITLAPNASLVNGDVSTSAGVNLGTLASAWLGPKARHLGAQLPDAVTPVSEIAVHVDRVLPAEIAGLFTWTAWRSGDNATWTPVALAGPVAFDPRYARFAVPIATTRDRYLKVVTAPLPSSATTDPAYGEIFVTELQLFEVVPIELGTYR